MTSDGCGGRRLMAASNTLWISEISEILRQAYPDSQLPQREMPNFMVKMLGMFDTTIKSIVSDVGIFHEADASYVTTLTGVMPRPAKDAVLSAAASLFENGQIKS